MTGILPVSVVHYVNTSMQSASRLIALYIPKSAVYMGVHFCAIFLFYFIFFIISTHFKWWYNSNHVACFWTIPLYYLSLERRKWFKVKGPNYLFMDRRTKLSPLFLIRRIKYISLCSPSKFMLSVLVRVASFSFSDAKECRKQLILYGNMINLRP